MLPCESCQNHRKHQFFLVDVSVLIETYSSIYNLTAANAQPVCDSRSDYAVFASLPSWR